MRRLVFAVAGVAVLAIAAGVVSALLAGVGAGPLPGGPAAGATGPNGEPQIVSPDPAVEFPKALQGLANPPSHLAADPKTGDVWFLVFTYDGVSNTLYHYSPATGRVETFSIPSGGGSEIDHAIAVDARGHVIVAEGSVVTDFDPAAGRFSRIPIPAPETPKANYVPVDGAPVLDMALGDAGVIYLSRMNIPAITELDLTTGASREYPYPVAFGPADDIEVGDGGVWMTSRWSIEGVSEAQAGWIGLPSGVFVPGGRALTALGADGGGKVLGVLANTPDAGPGLARLSAGGQEPVSLGPGVEGELVAAGLGILDYLAVDPERGVVWVASWGGESVLRVDTLGGTVREYKLPVYDRPVIPNCDIDPENVSSGTEPDPCAAVGRLRTQVRGLAVVPNGDVYFSDATLNRIGVIHAGK